MFCLTEFPTVMETKETKAPGANAISTEIYYAGGLPIRYGFDRKLLTIRRLQFESKVQIDVLDKLLY